MELLDASYVTHAFARHAHDEFALGVIERGTERFEYRGTTYTAPAGAVLLFNPGEVHTGRAAGEEGWSMRMLFVDASLLRHAADLADRPAGQTDAAQTATRAASCRRPPDFTRPVVHDEHAASVLRAVHDAFARPGSRLGYEVTLAAALRYLVRHHAGGSAIHVAPAHDGAAPRAVQRAREYLDAHATEQVSLEVLAAVARVSPFHLARMFHAAIGAPPHVYLEQARIRHAKHLMRDALPLAQVALEAGFVDQSHFTKRFKALVGVTPAAYRFGCRGRKGIPHGAGGAR